MVRAGVRGLVLFVALVSWPRVASAQWFGGAFVGTTFDIQNPFTDPNEVVNPVPKSAMVWGASGGTHIFGKLGFEIEYQRSDNFFRDGEARFFDETTTTGSNSLQSLTVVAHYGWPLGKNGRFRPFVAGGGGVNFIDLGQELSADFDTFFALPPSQQTAIDNCISALGTDAPTVSQVQGCGFPLTSESMSTIHGVLTFGGGIVVKLANHVGARADIRYFMGIPNEDNGPFRFWRFTAGVVISK